MAIFEAEVNYLQNEDFRSHMDANWSAGNKQFDSVNAQFANLSQNPPSSSPDEIQQARIDANGNTYSVLKSRLDAQQVTAEQAYQAVQQKADADIIEQYFKNMSYVPETFANLAALQTAYPAGKAGLFITADTGHKYIWSNNAWTDAGIYQSAGIAAGAVQDSQISVAAKFGNIVSGSAANIDTVNKTLILNNVWHITSGVSSYDPADTSPINIPLDPNGTGSTSFWIAFSTISKKFVSYSTPTLTGAQSTDIYLGWISLSSSVAYDLHIQNVQVNGVDLNNAQINQSVYVVSRNRFDIISKTKTLVMPSGYKNLISSQKLYAFGYSTIGSLNLDTGIPVTYLYYDQPTDTLKPVSDPSKAKNSDYYLGYISWDTPKPNINLKMNYTLDGLDPQNMGHQFYNKSETSFGDSITESDGNDPTWSALIQEYLQLAVAQNAGINGTTYTKSSDRSDSAVERCASITGQDLIIVWFGINDFHYGRPLGTFANGDVSTFFGATDFVYQTLIANNPTASIIVLTPMKQHGYSTHPDSFTKNAQGLFQSEYVNAIKQVADYYSLPVLDLYAMGGLSAFVPSQSSAYLKDGLHPNQAGQYRLAQKIAHFIENNG
ncbi:SGNH/GDSL hydrolase family protein [Oenococcus sicerae]|uniref:SGNH/GDSL hydrolase family protein n=1 Tax=Oenococcus sicerae TaxID=2203724 RepID=A0AAJ1RAY3_9LACO|nr:SGNH/GDSL hydrolase family protein [Oenococcus sicerae]MDN6899580.1 SGNH/GDSL hydrolase family protein [Oenococcus sicerae]